MTFIRAPYIETVLSPRCKAIATVATIIAISILFISLYYIYFVKIRHKVTHNSPKLIIND